MYTSMIQSVSEDIQVLATNTSPINWVTDDIRSRNAVCLGWLNRTENTPNYKILEMGLYEVDVEANFTSETVGVLGFAIFADGIQVPGTEFDVVVGTADQFTHANVAKTLSICPREDINLTVQSMATVNGVDTQIPKVKNANIQLKRLVNN